MVQPVAAPKKICSSVRHPGEYRSDNGDEWATGEEAWIRGYGDCEDIAAAITELCSKKGIETETFMLYPENEMVGQAIVVGKWKGKLWFSSKGWFEYAKSGADVKREVAHEMRWKKKSIIAMDWDSFRGIESRIKVAGAVRIQMPIVDK